MCAFYNESAVSSEKVIYRNYGKLMFDLLYFKNLKHRSDSTPMQGMSLFFRIRPYFSDITITNEH